MSAVSFGDEPRPGWSKSESGRRLPGVVSAGILTRVVALEVLDAVISARGHTEQRRRSWPARAMAQLAMAMHADGSFEDVPALIVDGLAFAKPSEGPGRVANTAATSHGRERPGPDPAATLFEHVARPVAGPGTPGCCRAGRRLVAIEVGRASTRREAR